MRRGKDEVVTEFVANPLRLLVEEHHRDLGTHSPRPAAVDEGTHLGVLEKPVVDVLATLELDVGLVLRGEDPRMGTVPRVVIGDVGEVAHPPVDAQQVERRRAREVDRHVVGAEEVTQLRHVSQRPVAGPAGVGRRVGRVRGDVHHGRIGHERLALVAAWAGLGRRRRRALVRL